MKKWELGREAFCGDRIRKSEVPCPFHVHADLETMEKFEAVKYGLKCNHGIQ